ncbi:putative Sialic acid-binding periplasmic protein SiaP [uncultured delta proteobacterium]|uniref:Putative Sialic acid-binding periplasmic protein SiaP n=1 Tax=uncultured delta proteobacterium TaxID=34034 RepID=A0A212JCN9_9DELT|nr:putative Sialic acid-binding periplasmic protein SiaP [uncultured delta proteobacterium]
MKRKWIVALCLPIVACFIVAGFGEAAAAAKKVKLIFHTPTAENAINHRASLQLKKMLEEGSNGQIQLDVYTGGTLFGGDRETIEAMQRGDATFCIIATAPYVMFEPKVAVFDIPFIFDAAADTMATMDIVEDFLTSPEGKAAMQPVFGDLPKKGIMPLAFANQGFRELTANKAVQKVADLKGIKIRTMENKYHMAAWKLLGANPTPMAFTEVFTALEQGTIDAQENPYELIYTSKFYEVQKYIVNTHHIPSVHIFACSKRVYDSLSPELQKLVSDSMEKTARWYANEAKNSLLEKEKLMVAGKATILNITPENYAEFRTTTQPVVDMVKKDVGDAIVDTMLKAVAARRK